MLFRSNEIVLVKKVVEQQAVTSNDAIQGAVGAFKSDIRELQQVTDALRSGSADGGAAAPGVIEGIFSQLEATTHMMREAQLKFEGTIMNMEQ